MPPCRTPSAAARIPALNEYLMPIYPTPRTKIKHNNLVDSK